MLFLISVRSFLFAFCVFLPTIIYTLNILRAIKKMSVNEIRSFIFENYYKWIEFYKENSYYSMKHLKKKDLLLLAKKFKKKTDPCNGKEHYQLFLWKKNRKSLKQSKIITYQPRSFENPKIVDIESFITEHPKTSTVQLVLVHHSVLHYLLFIWTLQFHKCGLALLIRFSPHLYSFSFFFLFYFRCFLSITKSH